MSNAAELELEDPLQAGRTALSRAEWEQVRACFQAAVEQGNNVEAIEALAMAAWWLDDAVLTIESREQAYRLYREQGQHLAAARMANWLAWDYLAFRGEPAVANGWLQRAHRLLDDCAPAPEHGWLAIREGEIAFLLDNDVAATRRLAWRARDIGHTLGESDIELSALALEGLALASEGRVAEGIRQLDEASAAAVAGEMSQLWAVGRAGCYLITACERVRDFDRRSNGARECSSSRHDGVSRAFSRCAGHTTLRSSFGEAPGMRLRPSSRRRWGSWPLGGQEWVSRQSSASANCAGVRDGSTRQARFSIRSSSIP